MFFTIGTKMNFARYNFALLLKDTQTIVDRQQSASLATKSFKC